MVLARHCFVAGYMLLLLELALRVEGVHIDVANDFHPVWPQLAACYSRLPWLLLLLLLLAGGL